MKLVCWNMNFGGDEFAHPAPFVKKYIEGYDIVVFTEVVLNNYLINVFENNEYNIYSSKKGIEPFSNQIVIAVKKELSSSLVVDEIVDRGIDEKPPNYLHIKAEGVSIIGNRILSMSKEKQYEQCKYLAEHVNINRSLDENTIIVGDFNCGELRGDSNIGYDKVKNLYEYTRNNKKSNLRFYNFHLIRDMFENHILSETFGESKSWGISLYQDAINYGGAKIKNDLVLSSKDLNVIEKYSWDFVRDNEDIYYKMLLKNKNKAGNKIDHGYPDHAVLCVELKNRRILREVKYD